MAQQTVTVTGNLVEEPELVDVGSNTYVVKLRLASARSVRNVDENGKVNTEQPWLNFDQLYVDAEAWGSLAINIKTSLTKKGLPVIASGYFVTDEWEDKERRNDKGEPVKNSKIKLRVLHLGLDLNRFIVAYKRTDTQEHTPKGMDAAVRQDAADLVDRRAAEEASAKSPFGDDPKSSASQKEGQPAMANV